MVIYISVNLNQLLKLELAKYCKDSEMTDFISERSRNSKQLKKQDPLYFSFLGGVKFFNYFEFLLLSEIQAVISESLQYFAKTSFRCNTIAKEKEWKRLYSDSVCQIFSFHTENTFLELDPFNSIVSYSPVQTRF